MTLPSISVVIPARNMERWIGDTLQSVLTSDFPSDLLEIVIVDDGSTDRTRSVVTEMLKNSVVSWKIESSAQGGPSKARNLGLSRARGDWIQFLDADDLISADKLRHQGAAASKASSEVAVVYSAWGTIEEQNGVWEISLLVRMPQVNSDPLFQLLQSENFIATGSQLFRRGWLERVNGFDERHSFIEDVDLALRIAMEGGQFTRTEAERPLFFYRQRQGSLSRSDGVQFTEGCVRNARLVENHWRLKDGEIKAEQARLLLGIYGNALRTFYEHDRNRFSGLLTHVRELEPRYRPSGPVLLRLLSRLLGYPRAEAVALGYRRMKRGWGYQLHADQSNTIGLLG